MGELEFKAALLAASLSRFAVEPVEMVAGVPNGRINPVTQRFMESLGVRLAPVDNPFGDAYPIANKISCLGLSTDRSHSVLLDSDIVCVDRLNLTESFRGDFSAKLADGFTADKDDFKRIYERYGLNLALENHRATFSGQKMPLYFNAGVVHCQDYKALSRDWMTIAQEIDLLPLKKPRPWLDQLALPIAVTRLGLDVNYLTERMNFPLNCRLKTDSDTLLCHYHEIAMLAADTCGVVAHELLQQHRALAEIAVVNGLSIDPLLAIS